MTLLEVDDLRVEFRGRGWRAPATEVLHGVSVRIAQGETLGLVGESGSGKTTLGRAILGLVDHSAGEVRFDGAPASRRTAKDRRVLSRAVQVIFQDPYTSLNPAMTVAEILAEPLVVQGLPRREARDRVADLLGRVGLPADAARRLAREFSGGQRQRIAIARALALEPRLIVCDEPVSALDLSTQSRVLDLLVEIQERTGVGYLFISHDLSVVRKISHRVAVMYRGDIVETGPAQKVTADPDHPYTRRLLMAAPVADPDEQARRRHERQRLHEELKLG